MKLMFNSGRKGVFYLCANGTPCSRVDEPMARVKFSFASVLPFSFARPASLHYEEHVYIYTHISDGVEIVYELPLLPSNTTSEPFLHKPGAVRSVD